MKRGRFAKLAAYYWRDESIIEAGETAELLYVRALSACASRLNDGHIDAALKGELLASNRKRGAAVAALLRVGLWQVCPTHRDCLVVRNYLDWNQSAETIQAAYGRDAARKRWDRQRSKAPRVRVDVRPDATPNVRPENPMPRTRTSLPEGQGQGSSATGDAPSEQINGNGVDRGALRARLADAQRAYRSRDRRRADPLAESGGAR